jgi:hypoxanthine phosphoribosyltransferase
MYASAVLGDIDRILIDRDRIAQRIREMGAQIRADYQHVLREGGRGESEIVLVPVLTGSIIFVADLMRELPHKIRISVVGASSYPGKAITSTGQITLTGDLPDDLAGKHVLIIDDILDSGRTVRTMREEIARKHPLSVRACVLLRKSIPSAMNTACEYVGFDIPDEFVVGYGLDYDNYYRNLPDIGTLKKEAMKE